MILDKESLTPCFLYSIYFLVISYLIRNPVLSASATATILSLFIASFPSFPKSSLGMQSHCLFTALALREGGNPFLLPFQSLNHLNSGSGFLFLPFILLTFSLFNFHALSWIDFKTKFS